MKTKLIIVSRESPLALAQTESVRSALLAIHPHLSIDILGITTQADKRLDVQLIDIGGKGLFVKELEEALLDGRADFAVHSMKDVPMDLPPGLILPVITKREDPRDVLVSNKYQAIFDLPSGATVGTSSLRRQTQLRALRSDLNYVNLRGNIHTRLKRLDQGDYDAIILAAAGLQRMSLEHRISSFIDTTYSLPSAGQGALGLECRDGDAGLCAMLAPLNHLVTQYIVMAERALCRELGGGCKVPVAAYAEMQTETTMLLKGLVANQDGSVLLRAQASDSVERAEKLGRDVAATLLTQGAADILKAFE